MIGLIRRATSPGAFGQNPWLLTYIGTGLNTRNTVYTVMNGMPAPVWCFKSQNATGLMAKRFYSDDRDSRRWLLKRRQHLRNKLRKQPFRSDKNFETGARAGAQRSVGDVDRTTKESNNEQSGSEDTNKEEKAGEKSKTSSDTGVKPPGLEKKIEFQISVNSIMWTLVLTIIFFSLLSSGESVPEISYEEFKAKYLDVGQVDHLEVINGSIIRVYARGNAFVPVAYFTIGSIDSLDRRLREAQDELDILPKDRIPVDYKEEGGALMVLASLLPTLLFLGFIMWMARQTAQRAGSSGGMGGVFGVGKSKAHLYDPQKDIRVKFEDVAGMDEAKVEIMEFVKFLQNPQKYERLGAKIPKGAILSGAPGTGKTLLAKATAGEANVPFFAVSGSEFVEMFSGVGASRVRDLFKKAKEAAPSIIWIDEIDAIGKSRSGAMRGGNDEREATLNQLLVEMDGFGSNQHVVVLAGTNRADVLDKALLRPGRFDRRIVIDLPTLDGRKDIYKVHLRKIKYNHAIAELAGKLAAMTPGFSGADIANCCNEAALAAARENSEQVEMKHFEMAIDRVIAGLERRTRVLPKNKRRIVAYHEAGHAVAGWFLKYADPLVKVTIVPHGSAALGYAQLLPNDSNITSEDRMRHIMTVALGGRVSEEIFFDTVTVGASDDFKRITGIARAMVCEYGMSSKVGTVRLERPQGALQKSYSEETDSLIDEEIRRLINEAHKSCKELLEEKKDKVSMVAEELLLKEVLTRADLVRILGPRPHAGSEHEAFKKYLDVQ